MKHGDEDAWDDAEAEVVREYGQDRDESVEAKDHNHAEPAVEVGAGGGVDGREGSDGQAGPAGAIAGAWVVSARLGKLGGGGLGCDIGGDGFVCERFEHLECTGRKSRPWGIPFPRMKRLRGFRKTVSYRGCVPLSTYPPHTVADSFLQLGEG